MDFKEGIHKSAPRGSFFESDLAPEAKPERRWGSSRRWGS